MRGLTIMFYFLLFLVLNFKSNLMELIFSENFNGGSFLSVMFVTVCTFIT